MASISTMVETSNGQNAVQVDVNSNQYGWVFYRHPVYGRWVTLRRALPDELQSAIQKFQKLRHEADDHNTQAAC